MSTQQVLPIRQRPGRRPRVKYEAVDAVVARLPPPISEKWEWQLKAACRDLDSSLFFPPDRERPRARASRITQAKAVCGRCPAIAECLAHAIDAGEPFGVWGGRSEEER